MYSNKYSFSKHRNAEKDIDKSLETGYNRLARFYNKLNEFQKFTSRTVNTKETKKIVYNNAKNLFNKLLSIYCNDYNNTPDEEKEKMGEKIIIVIGDLLIKGTRFIELKKEDKEKSKSQPEETIAEIV